MGYTHYWKARKHTAEQFKAFSGVCRELYNAVKDDIEIASPMGSGEPVFSDTEVSFNGRGDKAYESFTISLNGPGGFCKTQHRPYDVLVCACLIAAKNYIGFFPSSDGNIDDWAQAEAIYEGVTGKKSGMEGWFK